MGTYARAAGTAAGVALLFAGVVAAGLGSILRETGIFGTVLLVGGGYVALHGAGLLVQVWIAARRGR